LANLSHQEMIIWRWRWLNF